MKTLAFVDSIFFMELNFFTIFTFRTFGVATLNVQPVIVRWSSDGCQSVAQE